MCCSFHAPQRAGEVGDESRQAGKTSNLLTPQSRSAEQGPGAIPRDSTLARPKSLQQTGVPVEATLTSAPPENPQTPEKIALGEKLFFDGRLSVDGTVMPPAWADDHRALQRQDRGEAQHC